MEPTTPTTSRSRLMVFVAIGIAVLAIIAIVTLTVTSRSQKPASDQTSATPSDTPEPTPTPEETAKAPAQPTFIGLNEFTELGLTDDQLSDLKYAFTKYASSSKKNIATVTTTSIVAAPHDPQSESPVFTINFTATLDNTVYKARFDYHDLSAGRLILFDQKSNAQVFDSGDIDVYNGTGVN